MNNEKVVFICADASEVYGLTETGKFVYFDKQACSFVLKSSGTIMTMDKASIVKMPDTAILDFKHRGRYREPEEKEVKPVSRIKTMMTPVNVAIGMVGLMIILYLLNQR